MTLTSVTFAGVGCVVELMQSGRPLLAWILEEESAQLRLVTINKREMKLAANRLLPWLGPQYSGSASRQEIQERLGQHKRVREEYAAQMDVPQLWELAQGEISRADAQWFASLIWSEPDVDQVAAMGQTLLNHKTHFKFSPPFFEVYPAELVEQRESRQKAEEARMELVTKGSEFFRHLYEASRKRKAPQEVEGLPGDAESGEIALALRKILKERVADPDAHDPEGLWKMLVKALPLKNPGDDESLPLILATAWGIFPEHYNFWMDRAGYDPSPGWFEPWQRDLDNVEALVDNFYLTAKSVATEDFVSIDPDSTRDWDDAVAVTRLDAEDADAPGGYGAGIALACPALGWIFGSDLDKAVLHRGSSLYLPEAEYYMMPEPLALKLFSLKAGQSRPALLLRLKFDPEARLVKASPELVALTIRANLTQKQCESVLSAAEEQEGLPAQNPAVPFAPMLKTALELAGKLQARRVAAGAVVTERPDVEIFLQDKDRVCIAQRELLPLVQTLVGELMIAATFALSGWCRERELPLIYRSQDVALPKEFAGVWRREEDIARVLKTLPPSILGLEAKPHAGLGLKYYSSFTAPMRRYQDLLNEAQVVGFLRGRAARFSKEELAALLPQVSSRLELTGQIQRHRPRYWKLLFFQQQEQLAPGSNGGLKYWDATITDENNYFVQLMLDIAQINLRAPRELCGERIMPGARVKVRLGKIDPLRNDIQVMEILDA
ncbi:MAG: RNB domain-containing ribonuclease [Deltaproteobacteria bacterium]|jgi:exoribonuclease-2|nr:RNB domain-containing ribonuclease [Deltaproteobacteria bacterium]